MVWGDFASLGATGTTYEIHDYHLTSASSCIDAADNLAVPPDGNDLDADGDVSERTPLDVGDTSRFVDDPDATDLGIPDPPDYPEVVDEAAAATGVAGIPGPSSATTRTVTARSRPASSPRSPASASSPASTPTATAPSP